MRCNTYNSNYTTATASVVSTQYREYIGEISIFFNQIHNVTYQSVSMTVSEAVGLLKSLENALKEYYEETERGSDPDE